MAFGDIAQIGQVVPADLAGQYVKGQETGVKLQALAQQQEFRNALLSNTVIDPETGKIDQLSSIANFKKNNPLYAGQATMQYRGEEADVADKEAGADQKASEAAKNRQEAADKFLDNHGWLSVPIIEERNRLTAEIKAGNPNASFEDVRAQVKQVMDPQIQSAGAYMNKTLKVPQVARTLEDFEGLNKAMITRQQAKLAALSKTSISERGQVITETPGSLTVQGDVPQPGQTVGSNTIPGLPNQNVDSQGRPLQQAAQVAPVVTLGSKPTPTYDKPEIAKQTDLRKAEMENSNKVLQQSAERVEGSNTLDTLLAENINARNQLPKHAKGAGLPLLGKVYGGNANPDMLNAATLVGVRGSGTKDSANAQTVDNTAKSIADMVSRIQNPTGRMAVYQTQLAQTMKGLGRNQEDDSYKQAVEASRIYIGINRDYDRFLKAFAQSHEGSTYGAEEAFGKYMDNDKYYAFNKDNNLQRNPKHKNWEQYPEMVSLTKAQPSQSVQSSGRIIINPKTGERRQLVNGQWTKM